jgi:hypothetical protein
VSRGARSVLGFVRVATVAVERILPLPRKALGPLVIVVDRRWRLFQRIHAQPDLAVGVGLADE